jgi:DNA-binding MarR family transcriptional regulator
MKINLETGNIALRLWFMIHRTHEMLKMCEDRVFREYKLTTEQYVVLVTIKYLDSPVRPTDIARWLGRSPNSVSMMVDRMVKAGLLRRVRDRKDRRVVWLTITNKGENALKPAVLAGFEFIQKILSQLSYDDRHTLIRLLDKLQYAAASYLDPGADIEEIRRNEAKSHDNLMERLIQFCGPQLLEAERQSGKKGKTI